jgi:hypothetical protein
MLLSWFMTNGSPSSNAMTTATYFCPGTRFVKLMLVVSPPTESQLENDGAYLRRSESGFTSSVRKSNSRLFSLNTLNLYFTGLFVPRPSGSLPFHVSRNDGPNVGGRRWFGTGFRICTVGAIVNDVNEHDTGAEVAPRSSTASSTIVWKPIAVWSVVVSTWSAWNRKDFRLSVVLVQTVSALISVGGSIEYRK